MTWLGTASDAFLENWTTAAAAFVVTLLFFALRAWFSKAEEPIDIMSQPVRCGNTTVEELAKYDGRDPFRPIYFAVKGQIFDVTTARDFYGPGGTYHVFAGKECARALAKMAIEDKHCNVELGELTLREQEILQDWEFKFHQKYHVVGQVVEPQSLSLKELLSYNGEDSEKPIYLAIKGTVFDVTKGKEFYGPDGIYPFAGRECARAFALLSTNTDDCHDNLEGLDAMELDNLRDWQAKFYYKYPIIGQVV